MVNMLECNRCKHTWYPNDPTKKPKVCPKCKNYSWEKKEVIKNENNNREVKKDKFW